MVKPISGGEEPKPQKSLTYDQINKWSDYVEKNPSRNFDSLWAGFVKQNPKTDIDKSILQKDLYQLREIVQRYAKKDGTDLNYITTGYSFPKVSLDGKDYGRVNASMMTKDSPMPQPSYPSKLIKKEVPSGVTEVWFDSGKNLAAYENPHTGDIEYADKSILNYPRFKKAKEQNVVDIASRSILNTRL